MKLSIIIPALNEERSIGLVIKSIPKIYREVVVIDNGSSDDTSKVALENGATVITEKKKGYG
jgi:glycosyltransferase involved in cell wall biosynthesis